MREVGKRRTVVKDVFITEMTAISSIGDSLDDMLPPLYKGETAVDTIDRFSTEKLEFHKGACISWLDSKDYDNRISELQCTFAAVCPVGCGGTAHADSLGGPAYQLDFFVGISGEAVDAHDRSNP